MKFEDVLDAKEKYRKKIKTGIITAVAIIVVVALIAIPFGYTPDTFPYLFLVCMVLANISLAIIVFSVKNEEKEYKRAYKTYFVERNLANVFTDLKYDHASGFSRDMLNATKMINTGDRYNSNDFTTGKYKDVNFSQADVHIEILQSDGDGHSSYSTLFKGRFMIFEFPKKFIFRLMVAEKGFRAARFSGKDSPTGRKFRKISMESGDFNDKFNTYAEDGFEAFYLLGPDFIANILELNNEHKGQIMLGFLDNQLLVGLQDGKDAFEAPGVFKKLDEAVETEKVAKEIRLITNFVDKLKLDHKLFKS